MAASFDVAGVRVDHGSHRLHRATPPAVLGELQRLLGDDLQLRPRHGRLRFPGHWLDFPLRAPDLARHLPPRLAVELGRDAITRPWRAPADDSFAALVTAGLGPTVANRFYLPYARELFGVPVDELDGELARRRVSSRTATSVIKRLGGRRASPGRSFYYPRRGFGQIARALAEAAAAAGVALRTGADVTAIDLRPDGVTVHLADGEQVDGDRLWSTVPATALARLAGEPFDGAGLRSRAMALVYLVLEQPRCTAFDAH